MPGRPLWRLKDKLIAILIKKIKIKFLVVIFFSILDHQTLDPDPGSGSAIRKNAGSGSVSGSALNQCGSETLRVRIQDVYPGSELFHSGSWIQG
jgi:hypothetical protein